MPNLENGMNLYLGWQVSLMWGPKLQAQMKISSCLVLSAKEIILLLDFSQGPFEAGFYKTFRKNFGEIPAISPFLCSCIGSHLVNVYNLIFQQFNTAELRQIWFLCPNLSSHPTSWDHKTIKFSPCGQLISNKFLITVCFFGRENNDYGTRK